MRPDLRQSLHARALAVVGTLAVSLPIGCTGDDATGEETSTSAPGTEDSGSGAPTSTGPGSESGSTAAAADTSTGGEPTTGGSPTECAAALTQEACASIQLDIGSEIVGACGWRSTVLVSPARCATEPGPGACFTATNLDGCYSETPDSCGDGTAWFARDRGDGTIEMFEDSSMCLASDGFDPCDAGDDAMDPACACACAGDVPDPG
jgi:hypothetical protein